MSEQAPKAEIWSYDIETLSNLFTLIAKRQGSDEVRTFRVGLLWNEVEEMADFMTKPPRDYPLLWFVGYNNRDFDDRVVGSIIENVAYLARLEGDAAARWIYRKAQDMIDKRDGGFYNPPNPHFQSLDLFRITRLHASYKGLKLVGVNLKWKKIQDMPIDHKAEVQLDQVDDVLRYNLNDVLLTERLFENQREEIQLRNAISVEYGVDVMNEDRSGVANRLLEKFYWEATNIPPWEFKKLRTHRARIPLSEVIHDDVRFESRSMQDFLDRLRKVEIEEGGKKKDYKWSVLIGDTVYDVALGGLHSSNSNYPAIWETDEEGTLIDCDVASYYPTIVLNHRIKPAHLTDACLEVLDRLTRERLEDKAKMKALKEQGKTEDDPEFKLIKVSTEGKKISINKMFGAYGDEKFWLYDMKAMYGVTINGQLYLLMLIERLERAGIPVWYANTDGISAKVPPGKEDLFYEIAHEWEKEFGFELEFVKFKKAVIQDVNEYIIEKLEPKSEKDRYKKKGDLDDELYKDVTKSFSMPIIATAVRKYFFEGVPVMQTLKTHEDILDFCKAQNVGKQYSIEYHSLDEENLRLRIEPLQRTLRFFVATKGGTIQKRKDTGRLEALAGTKGQTVVILNDLPDDPAQIERLRDLVDLAHYERECLKIIIPFERQQTRMGF